MSASKIKKIPYNFTDLRQEKKFYTTSPYNFTVSTIVVLLHGPPPAKKKNKFCRFFHSAEKYIHLAEIVKFNFREVCSGGPLVPTSNVSSPPLVCGNKTTTDIECCQDLPRSAFSTQQLSLDQNVRLCQSCIAGNEQRSAARGICMHFEKFARTSRGMVA